MRLLPVGVEKDDSIMSIDFMWSLRVYNQTVNKGKSRHGNLDNCFTEQ